ncbi:unnamed protein product [Discula destructiva]
MSVAPQIPQILYSRRVLPQTPSPTGPITKALSIADAPCARFTTCGAIWFYDASPAIQDANLFAQRLEQSLRQTLDDYRHFAGQLRWSTAADATILPGPHTLWRPVITYNSRDDPGVAFSHASDPRTLNSFLPGKDRTAEQKVWRSTAFNQDDLLPSCPLAFLPDISTFEGLPGVSAQLTVFACGGLALGVRMTHCLGDAVCLGAFTKAWAERTRMLLDDSGNSENVTTPQAVFDPALLDTHACVSRREPPDGAKLALARSLPMHRYDGWDVEAPGTPAWARNFAIATKPDAQSLAGIELSPATPQPWEPPGQAGEEEDEAAEAEAEAVDEHVQIRVTAAEMRRLKEAAHLGLPRAGQFVSRLDALTAHCWAAVSRARGLQDLADEKVGLAVTLGLRSRVEPRLPDTFAGSPLVLGRIERTGAEVCSASLGSLALSLRSMVSRFTPEAVGAYLHDAAHEVSPLRLWQVSLGKRQLGVTSWTRAGTYEVDLGAGRPRYVQARMPRLAGQMQILDIEETGEYEVNLCLEKEAMERLLEDWSL